MSTDLPPATLITVVTRDGFRYVYTARTTPALEADNARAAGYLEFRYTDRTEGAHDHATGEHGALEQEHHAVVPWGNIACIYTPASPPRFVAYPPGQEPQHHQPARKGGHHRRTR